MNKLLKRKGIYYELVCVTQKETVKDGKSVTEKRVETVDFRSSAGEGHDEVKKVDVVHQVHSSNSNTSGGVLAGAAAAVASTLQSAKDALSKK